MTIIRRATDADIAPVLRLAQRMWSAAPALRDVPLDAERVATVAYRLVAAGTLLVVDIEGGAVAGFMAYLVAPDSWSGVPTASELALYVAPEYRGAGHSSRLLAVAEAHARDAGARSFTSGTSLGDPSEAACVTYTRAGWVEVGRCYRKRLEVPAPVA